MGCLAIVISTTLTVISMCSGFYYLFSGDFVIGAILLILSVLFMLLGGKGVKKSKSIVSGNYISEYPEVGFLYLPYLIGGKYVVELEILSGPINTDDLTLTGTTSIFPTYYLPVGDYEFMAKFTSYRLLTRLIMDRAYKEPKIIRFKVQNKTHYELSYDTKMVDFVLVQTEMPKTLYPIIKQINEANEY